MWNWLEEKIVGPKTGRIGEAAAARHLQSLGQRILARNFRNRRGRQLGEIDIVSRDGDQLVFVEVKTRTVAAGGIRPESAITPQKLRRMERAAQAYLKQHGLEDMPYRFDGVSVWVDPSGRVEKIEYLPSLFF